MVLLILAIHCSCCLSGQIVYTDLNPDVNYYCAYAGSPMGGCENDYYLDLNNDGTIDFDFSFVKNYDVHYGGSDEHDKIEVRGNNLFTCLFNPLFPYSYGDTINASSLWFPPTEFYWASWGSDGSYSSGGWWPNYSKFYVGLKLIVGTHTYYGWIGKSSKYLTDYAYELSKNYIVAGYVPAGYGISDNSNNNLQFTVFPNPSSEKITLTTKDSFNEECTASILNITGDQTLIITFASQDKKEIDISTLAKGLYFIKLSTADGSVVRKFVKE